MPQDHSFEEMPRRESTATERRRMPSGSVNTSKGLGKYINDLGALAGMSQEDMARGLGTSQQTISRTIRGLSKPRTDSPLALALQKELGISAEEVWHLIRNQGPWSGEKHQKRKGPRARQQQTGSLQIIPGATADLDPKDTKEMWFAKGVVDFDENRRLLSTVLRFAEIDEDTERMDELQSVLAEVQDLRITGDRIIETTTPDEYASPVERVLSLDEVFRANDLIESAITYGEFRKVEAHRRFAAFMVSAS